jgi:hypothetical protein
MKSLILILILLLASSAKSADTASHGVQGFIMTSRIAEALGASKDVRIWTGVVGGILGMYPDLAGLYGNAVLHDNWKTYTQAHSGKQLIAFLPPVSLHILLDRGFHEQTTDGWTKDAWKWEVVVLVVNIILIYLEIKSLAEA